MFHNLTPRFFQNLRRYQTHGSVSRIYNDLKLLLDVNPLQEIILISFFNVLFSNNFTALFFYKTAFYYRTINFLQFFAYYRIRVTLSELNPVPSDGVMGCGNHHAPLNLKVILRPIKHGGKHHSYLVNPAPRAQQSLDRRRVKSFRSPTIIMADYNIINSSFF